MKNTVNILFVIALVLTCGLAAHTASAHCEIPCGIYGDSTRVDLLREHFKTIEKSMLQIKEIEKDKKPNSNQLVRWVTNKEAHANEIQEIVCQYFMNQRVKPVAEDAKDYKKYVTQITLLHRMLVSSMKCKQTTDEAHVKELRTLLDAFEESYFAKK